jgi:hypothetical protein
MDSDTKHVLVIEKKVTELSDALAHLGRGTSLRELIKIIKNPGWTTPAEFLMTIGMLDAISIHANAIESLGKQLVKAAKQVN